MKKVMLYYPKTTGNEDSSPLYRGLPLSLLTLAAQLDKEKYEILLIDGRIESWDTPEIIKWLDDIICVGISSMTSYQIKDGLEFASFIRSINKSVPIVWGGWHPSLMSDQTIQDDLVDIIIVGQGDITFPALVEQLKKKGSLNKISNLVLKDESKRIVHTRLEPLIEFSKIKSIENAYSLIDVNNYIQSLWGNKRVVGYESSRGCPWRCRFCSIGSVYEGRWNALPAERVASEVEYLYHNYNIDAIHFFDNNFFVDKKRVEKFSSILIDRGINIKWDGTSVVEQFVGFSDDYIELLKSSGFFRVIVGVESGDEDVLERLNKRHRNEQVLELVKKCDEHGIMASLSFMVGFPWNPQRDINKTIELIEKIKEISPSTEILLFIFTPYVGTELFNVALNNGLEVPKSLIEWSKYTYEKVNTPWLSPKLVRKINRYTSFFGTKNMSKDMLNIFKGVKNDGNSASA